MAKNEGFKMPEDAYPDSFEYPKPDSRIQEFLSYEEDLVRYAHDETSASKEKLRSWGVETILTVIETHASRIGNEYTNIRWPKTSSVLATILKNAVMSRLGLQRTGTYEEYLLLFLKEIGFDDRKIELELRFLDFGPERNKRFNEAARKLSMHSIFAEPDEE